MKTCPIDSKKEIKGEKPNHETFKFPLACREKYVRIMKHAGYVEKPEWARTVTMLGGFSCMNCKYFKTRPDKDVRPLANFDITGNWCNEWGFPDQPYGCCSSWKESDQLVEMVKTKHVIEQAEKEKYDPEAGKFDDWVDINQLSPYGADGWIGFHEPMLGWIAYQKDMREKVYQDRRYEVDPISVYKAPSGKLYIVDGRHRVAAYEGAGRRSIRVNYVTQLDRNQRRHITEYEHEYKRTNFATDADLILYKGVSMDDVDIILREGLKPQVQTDMHSSVFGQTVSFLTDNFDDAEGFAADRDGVVLKIKVPATMVEKHGKGGAIQHYFARAIIPPTMLSRA